MQKFNAFRSRKLLDSAKGQTCQNCGVCDGSIVAAHSNEAKHGKGKSIKSADCFIAYLCHTCHNWYDERQYRDDPSGVFSSGDWQEMWQRAHDHTLHEMFKHGIIKVE